MKHYAKAIFLLAVFLQPLAPLWAQHPTITTKLGMEFVLIKPGSLLVGQFAPGVRPPIKKPANRPTLPDPAYAQAAEMAARDARPGFQVSIDRPFYLGKYEVTQAQWEKVMGRNPSFFQGEKVPDATGQHPVENVTWAAAQAFVRKLNKTDKDHHYRLPTEFEWEYAARAGAEGNISWPEARAQAVLGATTTMAVGQKQPNAWGLYDMLGNVWEWVQDYYNEQLFPDPVPPRSGKEHVLKGASFTGDSKNGTYLTHAAGPGNGFDVGLRLLIEVKE